jgi:hypothetical protein
MLSIVGAAGAIGFFSLFVYMGFFWLKCDTSSKRIRAFWFVIILLGITYGSLIAYYSFVYLPAVVRNLRSSTSDEATIKPLQLEKRRKLFGPFGWALLTGWGLLFLATAASFIFPKGMSYLLRPISAYFVLWPASLLIGTWAYAIILIFRAGMKRPVSSLPSNHSEQP